MMRYSRCSGTAALSPVRGGEVLTARPSAADWSTSPLSPLGCSTSVSGSSASSSSPPATVEVFSVL